VKVNVILADTGSEDPAGKLNLLGAGWTVTPVARNGLTGDCAVAVMLEVPWEKCNRQIEVTLELVNEDGAVVVLPTAGGEVPLRVTQKVVVSAPPGAPNGSPGYNNLLAKFQGGLPLQPGIWYAWRVTVDDESRDDWLARFFVQRVASPPTFGATSGQ
jgi:hypothetical protein